MCATFRDQKVHPFDLQTLIECALNRKTIGSRTLPLARQNRSQLPCAFNSLHCESEMPCVCVVWMLDDQRSERRTLRSICLHICDLAVSSYPGRLRGRLILLKITSRQWNLNEKTIVQSGVVFETRESGSKVRRALGDCIRELCTNAVQDSGSQTKFLEKDSVITEIYVKQIRFWF
jgi:hypothetical protein